MTNPLSITDDERDMTVSEFMKRREDEREALEMFRSLSRDEKDKMLWALREGTQEALEEFGAFLRQSRGLPDDWPNDQIKRDA